MRTSSYEKKIIEVLNNTSFIKYTREKTFPGLRSYKNRPLRFDFAIYDLGSNLLCICEVDGEQHFKKNQYRDEMDVVKNAYCLRENIKLYRIPYNKIDTIKTFYDILSDEFLVKTKWHNHNLRRRINEGK